MKTVVSLQDLAELEIKPGLELEEFYLLVRQELERRWADQSRFLTVACPACGSSDHQSAFDRYSVKYVACVRCGSVFANPRPSAGEVAEYYRSSGPALFWREQILGTTQEARLEKIIRPRAEWVLDGIAEHYESAAVLLDISTGAQPLLSELVHSRKFVQVTAANPMVELETGWAEEIEVRPSTFDRLGAAGSADVVTAFDVFDRTTAVPELVTSLAKVLRPGGLLFLTAPTVSGFETQVLWERSSTMTPPDKLNILSTEGFARLFSAPLWELIELSTPGMFDVETVKRSVQQNPDHPWPRFIRYLMLERDELALQGFLEFLQINRLTSFARLLVRRAR